MIVPVTVLCYHSVESGWVSPLTVDPHDFARHCAWLARRRVVGLEDVVPAFVRDGRLARGTVALTFDDGFAALYEHALPVLQRHRLPATMFVVARTVVGDNQRIDWIQPEPPIPQRALSREQILHMRELGMTFGSHSFAHHELPLLGEDECYRDLRDSREVLEDLLGEPIRLLAYPYGKHAAHVRRAAERAGFDFALSLPDRREPVGPFAVPRAGVYRGNGTVKLWAKTSRWYLAWRTGPFYPMARRLLRATAPMPNS